MRNVRCAECGEFPWLVEHEDSLYVRCDCKEAVAIDSAEHRYYVPEKWE